MLVTVFGIHLVRSTPWGYRLPVMVLVRVLLVRCYVVWFVVICRFTCVQVFVVLFTSPGSSISLVVVFGTDKSGCGKLERSRVKW